MSRRAPVYARIPASRVTIKPRDAGRKALTKVNAIEKLISGDRQHLITDLPLATVLTGGTFTHMTGVAQGNDENERSGNMIQLTSVSFSGKFVGTGGNTSNVRVVCMQDMDNQGGVPLVTEVFVTSTKAAEGDHRRADPNKMRRFKILYDKMYTIGGATANDNFSRGIKFSRKLNSKCYFTGTLATSEGKGTVWLMILSDLAASIPLVTGTFKVTFKDV